MVGQQGAGAGTGRERPACLAQTSCAEGRARARQRRETVSVERVSWIVSTSSRSDEGGQLQVGRGRWPSSTAARAGRGVRLARACQRLPPNPSTARRSTAAPSPSSQHSAGQPRKDTDDRPDCAAIRPSYQREPVTARAEVSKVAGRPILRRRVSPRAGRRGTRARAGRARSKPASLCCRACGLLILQRAHDQGATVCSPCSPPDRTVRCEGGWAISRGLCCGSPCVGSAWAGAERQRNARPPPIPLSGSIHAGPSHAAAAAVDAESEARPELNAHPRRRTTTTAHPTSLAPALGLLAHRLPPSSSGPARRAARLPSLPRHPAGPLELSAAAPPSPRFQPSLASPALRPQQTSSRATSTRWPRPRSCTAGGPTTCPTSSGAAKSAAAAAATATARAARRARPSSASRASGSNVRSGGRTSAPRQSCLPAASSLPRRPSCSLTLVGLLLPPCPYLAAQGLDCFGDRPRKFVPRSRFPPPPQASRRPPPLTEPCPSSLPSLAHRQARGHRQGRAGADCGGHGARARGARPRPAGRLA